MCYRGPDGYYLCLFCIYSFFHNKKIVFVMRSACYEVLTTATTKRSIFWHRTPCSSKSIDVSEEHIRLHLQGQRLSQARSPREVSRLLNIRFLLGLIFDTKDGGNMFFRNVGWLWTICRYFPEDISLHGK
jgi:hypothetical protein